MGGPFHLAAPQPALDQNREFPQADGHAGLEADIVHQVDDLLGRLRRAQPDVIGPADADAGEFQDAVGDGFLLIVELGRRQFGEAWGIRPGQRHRGHAGQKAGGYGRGYGRAFRDF